MLLGQTEAVVPSGGQFTPHPHPKGPLQTLETGFIVTTVEGVGVTGIQWVEAHDAETGFIVTTAEGVGVTGIQWVEAHDAQDVAS